LRRFNITTDDALAGGETRVRSRRPFLSSDIDLIRESLDRSLWRKVFSENALAFYHPRSVSA